MSYFAAAFNWNSYNISFALFQAICPFKTESYRLELWVSALSSPKSILKVFAFSKSKSEFFMNGVQKVLTLLKFKPWKFSSRDRPGSLSSEFF